MVSENPYRLAKDIRGIGFKTADAIASRLGIEKTALIRVRAGISFALTEAAGSTHAMQIRRRIGRGIEIDDEVHALNVNAASRL